MKLSVFFVLFLSALLSFADDVKTLQTNISNVTVFLSGAQIEHTGTIYLNPGSYNIVISDLPITINPNTIQVTGKGNITVLSVENRINYLKSQVKPKPIIILEDSLEILSAQINYQNAILTVYNNEEEMIPLFYDEIDKISETYADVQQGEKLALFNAAGYLEIAINKGNAAGLLGLQGFSERQHQSIQSQDFKKLFIYQTVKIFFQ